jgi:hypothetical protein
VVEWVSLPDIWTDMTKFSLFRPLLFDQNVWGLLSVSASPDVQTTVIIASLPTVKYIL